MNTSGWQECSPTRTANECARRAHGRESGWRWGLAALLVSGCGAPVVSTVDGGPGDRDTGLPASDAARAIDDAGALVDSGPPIDSGPRPDGGVTPEVCTGGIDEDGDRRTDCDDGECWTRAACIAADVAELAPGLVPCGDPIELDGATTAATCATIGTPDEGSSHPRPKRCDVGPVEATAHVFCDAEGAAAVLWIEERLDSPNTSRVISPTMHEVISYENAHGNDWERLASAAGAGGSDVETLHEDQVQAGMIAHHRIITVRTVAPSMSFSRLLGLTSVLSLIDTERLTSTDTRTAILVGGVAIDLPPR